MCGEGGAKFGCSGCVRELLGRQSGWIECKSISFPDHVYYFNIRTRCSTWKRPVPQGTQLPQLRRYQQQNYRRSPENENARVAMVNFSSSDDSDSPLDDSPRSAFELHARRMQIFLENHADHRLAEFYASGGPVREKLLECYRNAKYELARQLGEKSKKSKAPKRKVPAKPKPTRPTKIIKECNGIVTISYDPLPPEIPDDAKMSDLSETTVNSLMMQSVENSEEGIGSGGKTVVPGQGREASISRENRGFDSLVFKELNLSDSDTTISDMVIT
ncbi:uncharacterized protein LOC105691226 [Athalia rosae]|uniref:uncharacterized protein LOC105691226 n=1 Tax=Athalia rosae TaxID=37344 RepID=UPI002034A2EC|nr:uncharacterized protein LOC105691226 [Athalia rosae]XP_048511023.1 uncharacterized protein LOC105691226 [Athalia rosae]